MTTAYNCFLNLFGSLFVFAALVVWVIGGYCLMLMQHLSFLDANKYILICGITLLSVGIVFIIFATTAFREAYKKVPGCMCTLISFFSLSATIVVALVATAGLTVVLPAKIESSLKINVFDTFQKYSIEERSTTDVDQLQKSFLCCGVQNFADWYKTPYGKFPVSCCVNETLCLHIKLVTADQIYQTGCSVQLHEFFYSHFIYMVGGAVLLITIFLLCTMVACILMKLRLENN